MAGSDLQLDQFLEDDLICAALELPGLSCDLSTWRMYINRFGELRQVIDQNVLLSDAKGRLIRKSSLNLADVAKIMSFAQQIGFEHFRDSYRYDGVEDGDTTSITVRFGQRIKKVRAYDPGLLAHYTNDLAAKGYEELWERILKYKLYVPAE